jgi:hypothetical protein
MLPSDYFPLTPDMWLSRAVFDAMTPIDRFLTSDTGLRTRDFDLSDKSVGSWQWTVGSF